MKGYVNGQQAEDWLYFSLVNKLIHAKVRHGDIMQIVFKRNQLVSLPIVLACKSCCDHSIEHYNIAFYT